MWLLVWFQLVYEFVIPLVCPLVFRLVDGEWQGVEGGARQKPRVGGEFVVGIGVAGKCPYGIVDAGGHPFDLGRLRATDAWSSRPRGWAGGSNRKGRAEV